MHLRARRPGTASGIPTPDAGLQPTAPTKGPIRKQLCKLPTQLRPERLPDAAPHGHGAVPAEHGTTDDGVRGHAAEHVAEQPAAHDGHELRQPRLPTQHKPELRSHLCVQTT